MTLDNIRPLLGILVSAFDMILLMVYLNIVFGKTNLKSTKIVYITSFIAIHIIWYALSKLFDLWFVNIMFSFLGVFTLTLLYNSKIVTKIFAILSIQVFGMIAEVLSYGIIHVTARKEFEVLDYGMRFYAMLLSKLILFILIILVSFIVRRNSMIVRFKDVVCLIITPLISFITIIAITFEMGVTEAVSWFTICFIITGIMIINLIVYHLLENIIEATEIREKQSRMESQFAFQEQKYEQTSQSFKKISAIIHDTNKHLIYLRECFERDEKTEAISYINTAVDNMEKSYKRFNTGHLVVDALVSNAYNTAVTNSVNFKSDINIDKDRINIERYDLSVAFGNLLDNAIEACKKVSNLDDRYIRVSIFTSESALVINIVNSKKSSLTKADLKSDKADKLLHGYGLGNVGAIAEKYGGTFISKNNESSFEATVVLPLRDEN